MSASFLPNSKDRDDLTEASEPGASPQAAREGRASDLGLCFAQVLALVMVCSSFFR